ncbi:MAG: integrin alpha, partial [Bacteroidota bacterium]
LGQFPTVFELSDLNGTNGFVFEGLPFGELDGRVDKGAGDINADGFDDLILGDSYAGGSYPNIRAGVSYIVFGKSTSFSTPLSDTAASGTSGFTINGESAYNLSGASVSGVGDVNGDGTDDILIGAPAVNSNRGAAYVVFGSSTTNFNALDLSALDGINGFRIDGIANNDRLGGVANTAGDMNNDGIDDFILGTAGETYVIFGSSTVNTGSFALSSLDGTNGFTVNTGSSLPVMSNAGDINGDHFDDIIFGESSYGAIGKSYVVFGNSTGSVSSIDLSALNGTNGFTLEGANTGDGFGTAVNYAGDVNGDEQDDIIIGAGSFSVNNLGKSYVVFGSTMPFGNTLNVSSLDGTSGFVINGKNAYSLTGYSVSTAGDVNGDGLDDVIIGASNANTNLTEGAYVVFGNSTGGFASGQFDLSSLDGTNGFVLNGELNSQFSTINVGNLGDMNGDGVDDLFLIGSTYDNPFPFRSVPLGSFSTNRAYIIFGQSSCITVSPTVSVAVSPAQELEGVLPVFDFTFTASESVTCQDLIVNFSISGSASFSTDYTLSGETSFGPAMGTGTLTIPEGTNSAVLTVVGLDDAIIEPDETIIVTIENP